MFPLEYFELISLTIAENEEALGKRIQIEAFSDQNRQTVNRLAQIRAPTGEIHPVNVDFA